MNWTDRRQDGSLQGPTTRLRSTFSSTVPLTTFPRHPSLYIPSLPPNAVNRPLLLTGLFLTVPRISIAPQRAVAPCPPAIPTHPPNSLQACSPEAGQGQSGSFKSRQKCIAGSHRCSQHRGEQSRALSARQEIYVFASAGRTPPPGSRNGMR